jgi:hypothetical protein
LCVMVAALVTATAASAATSFSAHGGAEQVYVTGLAGKARMSLLRANGTTLYTQRADSLGGLPVPQRAAGQGVSGTFHIRRPGVGTVTVHCNAAAPWDPSVYNQSIPDNSYGYLTIRDGTQLSIYVHPPTSPAGEPGLSSGLPVPPSSPIRRGENSRPGCTAGSALPRRQARPRSSQVRPGGLLYRCQRRVCPVRVGGHRLGRVHSNGLAGRRHRTRGQLSARPRRPVSRTTTCQA